MPIVVKDIKWRQTPNKVLIQAPLNGIHPSKVDIFTSKRYVKASYAPFIFEVFPFEPIVPLESVCTFTSSEIVFELVKDEKREWDKLEIDLPRCERNKLKKEQIEEEHQRFQKECEEKQNKKSALKKLAVGEQIKLDTRRRELIENIKSTEKQRALGDLRSWEEKISPQKNPKIIELSSSESEDEDLRKTTQQAQKPKIISKPFKYDLKKSENSSVPLPRQTATVTVEFTERELPTPSRESRLPEEEEWFRKQAEFRRSVGFDSDDLRPEEKSPLFLKGKGDEFMKTGNYLAAISAYTFGLKLSDKNVDLYIKRSEAHFVQGNMQRTITDCSTALDLLKPVCSANFLDRLSCIIRRGKALFKFGMKERGFREVEIAYKMQPDNEELKNLLIQFMDEMNNCEKDDITDMNDPLIKNHDVMENPD